MTCRRARGGVILFSTLLRTSLALDSDSFFTWGAESLALNPESTLPWGAEFSSVDFGGYNWQC